MVIENAVVLLTWTKSTNDFEGAFTKTGCVISKKNNKLLILSCAHQFESIREVHEQKIKVKVTFSELVEKTGELYAVDIENDLSLVVVSVDKSLDDVVSVVKFNENPLVQGDYIWTIHNRAIMKMDRRGREEVDILLNNSCTNGRVSCGLRFDSNLSPTAYVEYWMPMLGPVSSGAPILNGQNQIVAVHSFQLQEGQYGIHVQNIKNFFKRIFSVEDEKSLNEIVAEIELV